MAESEKSEEDLVEEYCREFFHPSYLELLSERIKAAIKLGDLINNNQSVFQDYFDLPEIRAQLAQGYEDEVEVGEYSPELLDQAIQREKIFGQKLIRATVEWCRLAGQKNRKHLILFDLDLTLLMTLPRSWVPIHLFREPRPRAVIDVLVFLKRKFPDVEYGISSSKESAFMVNYLLNPKGTMGKYANLFSSSKIFSALETRIDNRLLGILSSEQLKMQTNLLSRFFRPVSAGKVATFLNETNQGDLNDDRTVSWVDDEDDINDKLKGELGKNFLYVGDCTPVG